MIPDRHHLEEVNLGLLVTDSVKLVGICLPLRLTMHSNCGGVHPSTAQIPYIYAVTRIHMLHTAWRIVHL